MVRGEGEDTIAVRNFKMKETKEKIFIIRLKKMKMKKTKE